MIMLFSKSHTPVFSTNIVTANKFSYTSKCLKKNEQYTHFINNNLIDCIDFPRLLLLNKRL